MDTEERLLTIAETAKRLRVCQRTVFYYIEQGKLKPVKLGGTKKTGKNLIPVEQIEKLLK
jgi:excisionase family DNA binding protein